VAAFSLASTELQFHCFGASVSSWCFRGFLFLSRRPALPHPLLSLPPLPAICPFRLAFYNLPLAIPLATFGLE
jgi:hypothetical protein